MSFFQNPSELDPQNFMTDVKFNLSQTPKPGWVEVTKLVTWGVRGKLDLTWEPDHDKWAVHDCENFWLGFVSDPNDANNL